MPPDNAPRGRVGIQTRPCGPRVCELLRTPSTRSSGNSTFHAIRWIEAIGGSLFGWKFYPLFRRLIFPIRNADAANSPPPNSTSLAITLIFDGGPAPSPLGVSAPLYFG